MSIKKQKGVTLIQTIAVIVILAILVSVATVAVFKNMNDSQLASRQINAELLNEVVSKYTVENGEVPTVIPGVDYISEPALIDISKVAPNEEEKFEGNYYIYGEKNKVYYDFPPKYIGEIFNQYSVDNDGSLPFVDDTTQIDVKKLYEEGYLAYKPFTGYVLVGDEVIQVFSDEHIEAKAQEDGKSKPTTPLIIPNKVGPYYENQSLKFNAKSNYAKGEVTYSWENVIDSGFYSQGERTVYVVAVGSDGVKSEKAEFKFKVLPKNEPPSKPTVVITPNGDLTSKTDISLTANATDPEGDTLRFKWLGEKIGNENGKTLTSKFKRGTHTVSVYAIDGAGNYSEKADVTFTVKNSGPYVQSVRQDPVTAYSFTPVTLKPIIIDEDGDLTEYQMEGLSADKIYPIGTHKIKITSKDSFGAVGEDYIYDLVINNSLPTKPTLTMTPTDVSDVRTNTTFTFEASGSVDKDKGDTFEYEWINKKDKYTIGNQTVKVRAVDNRGGASEWATVNFTIKNTVPTKPEIGMSPSSNLYANTTINWTVQTNSTDIDGDSITYEWDNKKATYPRGQHTVKLRAKDARNGYSAFDTVTFDILNSAPTITTLTTNKSVYAPGENVTYNVTSSDIDGDNVSYEWSDKISVTNEPGDFVVKVRGKDSFGGVGEWKTVSFKVSNEPPSKPTITVSPSGKKYSSTPLYISANGSVDPEGHTIRYIWMDGQEMNGGKLSPGIYEFKVKAVDAYGAESQIAVTVVQIIEEGGTGAGGLQLTGPNSKIYYPANGNLEEGATFTKFGFEVPYVSGHSGGDYGYVNGYNKNTKQWDSLAYQSTSNGIQFKDNVKRYGMNWGSNGGSYSNPTPGVYIRLEYFYYASHCMYGKSNITYDMEYEYGY